MKRRLGAKLDYDEQMDEGCVVLCDALNSLPGIITTESCCGHGRAPFRIWFKVTNFDGLFFLTRCTDKRYWKYGDVWEIKLSVSDVYQEGIPSITFYLGGQPSEDLPGQIQSLIENMNRHINHEAFLAGFHVNVGKFVLED